MPTDEPPPTREVLLRVFLETFDRYLRAAAEISAETGVPAPSIETLMAYCLSLPETDEIIYGFLRGDRSLFPDQARDLLDRDTRRLELDYTEPTEASEPRPTLDAFIKANQAVFCQVEGSPKTFMARWIMLHLMERTQARERGQRVIQEFLSAHPEFAQRLRTAAMRPAVPRQRP